MGQSSSVNSKSALPANLLVDASDSYVTELKLRSTAIIPISEYIKKDKYNKNAQQKPQCKIVKPREVQKEDKSKVKNTNKTNVEMNEKKQFLESSYKDIPDSRKWVNCTKQPPPVPKILSQKKQNSEEINTSVTNVHELYKNDVYPYIYKSKYKKNHETKQEENRKIVPTLDSDLYINKKDIKYHGGKQEISTHTLNKHHYDLSNQMIRKSKQSSFTIQTNVACIIHPEKKRYLYRICSTDNIRKHHNQKCSALNTNDYKPMKYVTSAKNNQQRIHEVGKHEEEQTKYLSARQALATWKHIHTLKQYEKQNIPIYYKEENYTKKNPRSRAGYKEISKTKSQSHNISPLEISNYNYSKLSQVHSSLYALHNKVEDRLQEFKHNKKIDSHKFKYDDKNSNKQDQKFNKNHHRYVYYGCPNITEESEEAVLDREDFLADIERCLKNHHKRATIYGRQYSVSKATWVQDKHRRWHKVILE